MKICKTLCLLIGLVGLMQNIQAQHVYTHLDTLRGSITPERIWWDLQHYELAVKVNPETKSIEGSNLILYTVLQAHDIMQIDLQAPLKITSVVQEGKSLEFKKEGPHHFVKLEQTQNPGDRNEILVTYEGVPHEAIRAPWDGGFTWSKDKNGNDFIATSCQGIGASIWWPCKDHMYDEPDKGITIHATVPENLTAVSNGRLARTTKAQNGFKTFTWEVINPINNYGVNINIADYTHFSEVYDGLKGKLDMNYWVLSYELEKAKTHFEDVPKMMKAFEHWFGPYPFYEDGYKLVEVPYWGMEHQSSVTYGNEYKKGMKGSDHTLTGWGTKFDFIIIHESGHEWFANNITNKDVADMWIHESFTSYSESLFIEYYYGKEAAAEYIKGTRMLIENRKPIISDYHVNTSSGGGDMYYKGANILHTLRQWVNDDAKWLDLLRALNRDFYHQTVTSAEIEGFVSDFVGLDLSSFFDQYLRDSRVPVFEYRIIPDRGIEYHWTNCSDDFKMPLNVIINGKPVLLKFENFVGSSVRVEWEGEISSFEIDSNYYVFELNVMGK